ncbi:unnamed protein product, partial [Prunus brigantina]
MHSSYAQSQKIEQQNMRDRERERRETPCARLPLKIRRKRVLRYLPKPYAPKEMKERWKSH